jgi:hypothetical protein
VLPSTCVSKEIRRRPSQPFLCGADCDFFAASWRCHGH